MSALATTCWPEKAVTKSGSRSHLHSVDARGGSDIQNLDLRELAQRTVSLLRATGRVNEDVAVQLELPAGPVFAQASRQRLEQVLLHLITHAADAQLADRAHAIRVTVEPQDDFGDYGPTFRVRHTGRSLTQQEMEATLTPSQRQEGSPQRSLAVARELVEAMGGQLSVRGRGRTGTTLTVELPDQGTASW